MKLIQIILIFTVGIVSLACAMVSSGPVWIVFDLRLDLIILWVGSGWVKK
jgi:hypothetical protein